MTLALMISAGASQAQLLLPMPSPAASVSQTFGVTDVKIEYSRPAVNDRKIWGGLVPYDKVWRTGANAATAVTFSTDVEVAGKNLAAGSYALFTIPGKDKWTVIFNTNEGQWGSSRRNEELDVISFELTPEMVKDHQERMIFTIEPINNEEAHIILRWEKLKLAIPVKSDLITLSMDNIEKHINSITWYDYARSAEFMVDNNKDMDKAQHYAEMSITLKKDHFFNQYVLAKVHAAKGNYKEAVKMAKDAAKQGEENGGGFYTANEAKIKESIKTWKKM